MLHTGLLLSFGKITFELIDFYWIIGVLMLDLPGKLLYQAIE